MPHPRTLYRPRFYGSANRARFQAYPPHRRVTRTFVYREQPDLDYYEYDDEDRIFIEEDSDHYSHPPFPAPVFEEDVFSHRARRYDFRRLEPPSFSDSAFFRYDDRQPDFFPDPHQPRYSRHAPGMALVPVNPPGPVPLSDPTSAMGPRRMVPRHGTALSFGAGFPPGATSQVNPLGQTLGTEQQQQLPRQDSVSVFGPGIPPVETRVSTLGEPLGGSPETPSRSPLNNPMGKSATVSDSATVGASTLSSASNGSDHSSVSIGGLSSQRRSPRSFSRGPQSNNSTHTTRYWGGNLQDNEALLSQFSFRASEAPQAFDPFSTLFDDIRAVPLVVEFPKGGRSVSDSFIKSHPSPIDRWRRMETIYIVMPSRFQVGVARTLAVPHGHIPLQQLVPLMRDFSNDPVAARVQVHFVGCSANFEDANLCVRNDVGTEKLPWEEISEGLSKIPKSNTVDPTRQKLFVDIGFAGTQCVGRNARCDLGLSAPRVLVVSRGSRESDNFFKATKHVDAALAGVRLFAFENPTRERSTRWGNRLGAGNTKEAARLHETRWSPDDSMICGCHNDGQNGVLSNVSFCNRVFVDTDGKWVRQGAVMYHRRSIDDYEKRRKENGPYLERLRLIVGDELKDRLVQSPASVQNCDRFEIADGLRAVKIPCNCEVESFYQPFIASLNRLFHGFQLDEVGILSCLLAMGQPLCTGAYVLATTDILLANKTDVKGDVGYAFLRTVKNLGVKQFETKFLTLPQRFSKYMKFTNLSRKKWLKRVRGCQREMKKMRDSETKISQDDYNGLYRYLMANVDGVGHLRSNHLIGICAIAGFVPMSMFAMINGGAGKAYLKLSTLFGKNVPKKEGVLENVKHLLQAMVSREVTERYAENAFCKLGRVLSRSDNKYYDVIDVKFPLFTVVGEELKLMGTSGKEVTVPSMFEFDGERLRANLGCKKTNRAVRSWMAGMME